MRLRCKLLNRESVTAGSTKIVLTFEKPLLTALLGGREKRCSLIQGDTLNAVPGAFLWIRKGPSYNAQGTAETIAKEHYQGWENYKSWREGTPPCCKTSYYWSVTKSWSRYLAAGRDVRSVALLCLTEGRISLDKKWIRTMGNKETFYHDLFFMRTLSTLREKTQELLCLKKLWCCTRSVQLP